MPKEYLLAGKMQVEQTKYYVSDKKRLVIAQTLINGAAFNMSRNLKYYQSRGKDVSESLNRIEDYSASIESTKRVDELMRISYLISCLILQKEISPRATPILSATKSVQSKLRWKLSGKLF